MNDQFRKLPHSSHLSTPGAETKLGRFFQKVNQFLKREPPQSDLKLQGRIHELQGTADKILVELLGFKNMLESIVEPNIFFLVSNIIDPIIKEISHIQRSAAEEQSGATQQVKTFHRYIEWFDKAKMWIELGSDKQYQVELIQQAIVDHTIREFYARIDRDIQVVQDYWHNSLSSTELDDFQKNELQHKIEAEITPHIVQLENLKAIPKELQLDTLTHWKAEADETREKYFGNILHIIDALLGEVAPSHPSEHESEYAVEILMQLNILEEKVSELEALLENAETLDERNLKLCRQTLMHLEDEAHSLNSNLRLTQEDTERVQQVIDCLSALREQI